MSNFSYIIRNYRPTDFDKYLRLNFEAEKLEPTGRPLSPQIISEHLHRPNYAPEQDMFLVETYGNIVGCLEVAPNLGIGRAILDCFIHPDHRGRGLASKLFDYATRRAQEMGAKVAHVNLPESDVAARNMLSRLGFRFVRRFHQLSLELSEVRWPDTGQSALICRHLQRGEEDKLAEIQNRSFAGTWGYNPNTLEEIIYWTNSSTCSPEDVVLACDGDKTVGFCWTRIPHEAATNERKGQIFMLGVDPAYRGRGIGKEILLAGLAYIKSKGLQVAELTVDSENKEACALYRSVGFKVQTSSLWYEKAIN